VVKTIDATVKKKKKKKKKQREEAGERSILDRSIAQQHTTIRQFGEGRKEGSCG
jgi:hypothetical protein